MDFQRIEQLREEYTDQYVVVDADVPELIRYRGKIGRVKTVSANGRALVEFDGDRGWHDFELDYLRVVDPPRAETAEKPAVGEPSAKKAAPTAEKEKRENLSPLERARLEKASLSPLSRGEG